MSLDIPKHIALSLGKIVQFKELVKRINKKDKMMNTTKLLKGFSYFLMIFGLLIISESCKKTENIEEIPTDEIKLVLNNDAESLSSRIHYYNAPILFSEKDSKSVKNDNGHTWYYVAEVESPMFNGVALSATHVVIADDKAYVTYNQQGTEHAGGIEVIDLSNPAFPSIISQELFDGTDINAVAIDYNGSETERKLWLAASSFKKGAVLREVILQNGLLSNLVSDVNLSKSLSDGSTSASANGIVRSADYIYVTAGQSHGGTFQLSTSNLAVLANEEYTHAKFPAVNGINNGAKQVTLSTGENSKLHVYNVGPDRTETTFDITPIYHQNVEEPYRGKSTLFMDQGEDICYVASGFNGLIAYDVNSGNQVYTSPAGMLSSGNTNGFAKDDDYVYLANGADGLYIATLPESGSGELIPVQVWDMNESGASANLVETDGDWIFVAKGGGGLKILRKIPNGNYPVVCSFDNQGVPECLEDNPEELCESLLSDLSLTLPEGLNAPNAHPEYFLNENTEIVLSEDAEVSVTFIAEKAGWRNTFGYYFYEENNPPASPDDLLSSMTVIFPNASAQGSGGGLISGDNIYQLGTFPAGTVIGYFMLANAWNGTQITEGLYTHYSIPEFNQNQTQQHILMYDYNCSNVLMTFEDILLPNGDKDFNDLIFQMNIESASAVSSEDFVQIPPPGN